MVSSYPRRVGSYRFECRCMVAPAHPSRDWLSKQKQEATCSSRGIEGMAVSELVCCSPNVAASGRKKQWELKVKHLLRVTTYIYLPIHYQVRQTKQSEVCQRNPMSIDAQYVSHNSINQIEPITIFEATYPPIDTVKRNMYSALLDDSLAPAPCPAAGGVATMRGELSSKELAVGL